MVATHAGDGGDSDCGVEIRFTRPIDTRCTLGVVSSYESVEFWKHRAHFRPLPALWPQGSYHCDLLEESVDEKSPALEGTKFKVHQGACVSRGHLFILEQGDRNLDYYVIRRQFSCCATFKFPVAWLPLVFCPLAWYSRKIFTGNQYCSPARSLWRVLVASILCIALQFELVEQHQYQSIIFPDFRGGNISWNYFWTNFSACFTVHALFIWHRATPNQ